MGYGDVLMKNLFTMLSCLRVVGYLSMKIGKAAATVVGGGLILMQLAAHQGYIQVNIETCR